MFDAGTNQLRAFRSYKTLPVSNSTTRIPRWARAVTGSLCTIFSITTGSFGFLAANIVDPIKIRTKMRMI